MDALDELPERTRSAFELYRSGSYTQREVAQQLGISTTLVNFMIRDARIHCRQSLQCW
jgi:RNA polymerase sigma factor (sigma-70 family)